MRHLRLPVFIFAACSLFLTAKTRAQPSPQTVEGHLRREPVLPVNLPDFELVTLDVRKEIVFHVGNQTLIGRVPVMAYVPVVRAGRARAMDRLIEARTILIKSAASAQVTTADLAAIRDLIEQATSDLRVDTSINAAALSAPTK